ncbi:ABC transporter substrate-binding protein [Massilia sp. W12]|uniref:ABC transporter substrate-binding protein n=1 Tax=Massilia sp. W12 TaxID=3126507 RepID=UPI0030D1FAC1
MSAPLYRRIAALSTEAVETLYLLDAQDCLAGISGYTVRPSRARAEKPKISGFSSAQLERILQVQPDLVIAFSDMQADLTRDLIRAGQTVLTFNQRDIAGIYRMIASLGALVDKRSEAAQLVADLQQQVAQAVSRAQGWTRRPLVYVEEWDQPIITGIGWIAEMVELAGGRYAFPEHAAAPDAKSRILADGDPVLQRAPDIVIASWCGKKFRPEQLCARPGWQDMPAVRNQMVFEIKSPDLLSPGPAAITHGLAQISDIIARWQEAQ